MFDDEEASMLSKAKVAASVKCCEILNATCKRSNVTPQRDVEGTLNANDKYGALSSATAEEVEGSESAKILLTGESKSR